ncbi:hypothetical protein GCM10022278_35910 [Allohahella marinimesophila]|uniref:Uncharacterized protein n=1 Tax=Allohahella marinimesophila TaxID=1054972 RepID=A0ABP7Q3V4_9GAMM
MDSPRQRQGGLFFPIIFVKRACRFTIGCDSFQPIGAEPGVVLVSYAERPGDQGEISPIPAPSTEIALTYT